MNAPQATIEVEAYRLRSIAEAGPIGKRHSSFELYDLLGQCMMLAERCASGDDFEAMRRLVAQQPARGNRRYVEKQSDQFTLVCRFVFGSLRSPAAERSNASRYAHCLRQAHKVGVAGAVLAVHLRDGGGINALFLTRPVTAQGITTKCLRLSRGVDVPKGATLALVLRHRPDNTFDVVQSSLCEAAA